MGKLMIWLTAKIINGKGHLYSESAAEQQVTERENIVLPNAHKI